MYYQNRASVLRPEENTFCLNKTEFKYLCSSRKGVCDSLDGCVKDANGNLSLKMTHLLKYIKIKLIFILQIIDLVVSTFAEKCIKRTKMHIFTLGLYRGYSFDTKLYMKIKKTQQRLIRKPDAIR